MEVGSDDSGLFQLRAEVKDTDKTIKNLMEELDSFKLATNVAIVSNIVASN